MFESVKYADMQMLSYLQFYPCQYSTRDLGMYSCRVGVTLCRLGTRIGGSKPEAGGRAGQTQDEMGQGNGADQGDVPGGVGRGETGARRGREGEGAS